MQRWREIHQERERCEGVSLSLVAVDFFCYRVTLRICRHLRALTDAISRFLYTGNPRPDNPLTKTCAWAHERSSHTRILLLLLLFLLLRERREGGWRRCLLRPEGKETALSLFFVINSIVGREREREGGEGELVECKEGRKEAA